MLFVSGSAAIVSFGVPPIRGASGSAFVGGVESFARRATYRARSSFSKEQNFRKAFARGRQQMSDGSTVLLASDDGSDFGVLKDGSPSSASGGADDRIKASRDMNPRCGVGAGDGAPARDAEGVALDPGGSSAMILRIEARISSMLGSAFIPSLDIPHLLATETLKSPGQGPPDLTIVA